MSYIAVAELKKTRELWHRLVKDRELVITRDGKPVAIMAGNQPDGLESSLREIRRDMIMRSISPGV